jgi:valyl-tRNA synthetase
MRNSLLVRLKEAQEKDETKFPRRKFELEQDPDVSDTELSSGLFLFSSLGWPGKTDDLRSIFPRPSWRLADA